MKVWEEKWKSSEHAVGLEIADFVSEEGHVRLLGAMIKAGVR